MLQVGLTGKQIASHFLKHKTASSKPPRKQAMIEIIKCSVLWLRIQRGSGLRSRVHSGVRSMAGMGNARPAKKRRDRLADINEGKMKMVFGYSKLIIH